MFKVSMIETHGDNNFEYTVEDNPKDFVGGIRQQGGYFTLDKDTNLVFVPWHQIHFIRFEEIENDVLAPEDELPTHPQEG